MSSDHLEPLPDSTDEWVREWFREVYNQLQQMASGLGLDDLREASYLVDQAYRAHYPAQVVKLSVPRGPDEQGRMLRLLDSALGAGVEGPQSQASQPERVIEVSTDLHSAHVVVDGSSYIVHDEEPGE